MMRFLALIMLFAVPSAALSQKKIIDHTVYNDWKTLSNHQLSADGKYVSYEINPHRGDGFLYIYDIDNDKLDSIPRGKRAKFSGDSKYLAFKIVPGYDTLRTCELDKVDKKKWPKDSLGIYVFGADTIQKYAKVKSFSTAEENGWIAVLYDHNDKEKKEEGKKKKKRCKRKKKKKDEEVKEPTSKGKKLMIFNPLNGNKELVNNVKDYEFSEKGKVLAYKTHQKDSIDSMRISVFNTDGMSTFKTAKFVDIAKYSLNRQENQIAFLTSNDTSKVKNYELYHWDLTTGSVQLLANSTKDFIPEEDAVSMHQAPGFSYDGKLLYFGVAEKLEEAPKDTLIDSEKVKLDIWHHADKRLQPQQLLELKRDEKKTDLYVYHLERGDAIQLSDDTLSVRWRWGRRWAENDPNKYLLAISTERYEHTYNWVIPYPEDHYLVSVETGEVKPLKINHDMGGRLSPAGKYYTYYDSEKHNHFVVDVTTNEETCVTCSIDNVLWEGDVNGMPMTPGDLGVLGWTPDESSMLIQSEFDIWKYNFSDGKVEAITDEVGSRDSIEMRLRKWAYDSVYVNYDNIYIQGFNRKTKGVELYGIDENGDFEKYTSYDARVNGIMRSKNKSQVVFKKMSFQQYPDLYLATHKIRFTKRISTTNPQQSEYNWGTVELVKWKSYDGTPLEGLLYKPEDFDPDKTYPLMVYFYELYSHLYHQHYIPKPTASIVFPTEYASAGYLVFIPDIRYRPGHPGQSAYDCIMSGTDHVLDLYKNVDSTRMALQGQSWGGYQTAQLVTMTTRYKAAMAGAPVTNMFSAYGGIRWGSGLNRQFQYEKTQSRIGHTIWEAPELYVENSPQFHLPKVETPLLIMHNDSDGAVPWYQGIELFTGLKRLGKKAWMLNYNDEQHNLMQNANRVDLSIRMRQFFDHYLQDKPAPKWLIDGLPAIRKGKELRY